MKHIITWLDLHPRATVLLLAATLLLAGALENLPITG
jgi:hypothetical protein